MRCRIRTVFWVAIPLLAASGCMNRLQEDEKAVPPFRVGACYLKSVSERHVADAKACGIDYFWDVPAADRKLLDLLHKYGIGAIATGVIPRWCGGNGSNAGKLDKAYPLGRYREGVRRRGHLLGVLFAGLVDEQPTSSNGASPCALPA